MAWTILLLKLLSNLHSAGWGQDPSALGLQIAEVSTPLDLILFPKIPPWLEQITFSIQRIGFWHPVFAYNNCGKPPGAQLKRNFVKSGKSDLVFPFASS